MADVGDRIAVASKGEPRSGVVTAVRGAGKKTAGTKPVAKKAAPGKKAAAGKAAPGKKPAAKRTSSSRRTGKKTR